MGMLGTVGEMSRLHFRLSSSWVCIGAWVEVVFMGGYSRVQGAIWVVVIA